MKSLSFSVSLLSLPPLSLLSDLPYRDPVHRPGPPGDARRALLDRGDELRGQLVDRREVAGFRRERPLLPQDLAAVGDRRRARGAGAARARAAPASSASAPSFSAPSSSKEPVELPRARADVNDPPSVHQQRQQSRRHAPRPAVVCVDRLLGLGAAPGVALEGDGGVVDEDGDVKVADDAGDAAVVRGRRGAKVDGDDLGLDVVLCLDLGGRGGELGLGAGEEGDVEAWRVEGESDGEGG